MNLQKALDLLGLEHYVDDVVLIKRRAASILKQCHPDVGGTDDEARNVVEARDYLIMVVEGWVEPDLLPVVDEVCMEFLQRFIGVQPDMHQGFMRPVLDDFDSTYNTMLTDYLSSIQQIVSQKQTLNKVIRHIQRLQKRTKVPLSYSKTWAKHLTDVENKLDSFDMQINQTNLKIRALKLIQKGEVNVDQHLIGECV